QLNQPNRLFVVSVAQRDHGRPDLASIDVPAIAETKSNLFQTFKSVRLRPEFDRTLRRVRSDQVILPMTLDSSKVTQTHPDLTGATTLMEVDAIDLEELARKMVPQPVMHPVRQTALTV